VEDHPLACTEAGAEKAAEKDTEDATEKGTEEGTEAAAKKGTAKTTKEGAEESSEEGAEEKATEENEEEIRVGVVISNNYRRCPRPLYGGAFFCPGWCWIFADCQRSATLI
jgi:hypothetical protein